VATGGTAIWSKSVSLTPDSNGVFNVILGENDNTGRAFPEFLTDTHYLGMLIAAVGETEMRPRQQLVSVPYAITARHVSGEGASVFIWTTSAPWYSPIFSRNETSGPGFGIAGMGRSAGVVGEGIGDGAGVEGYSSAESTGGVRGHNSRATTGDNPGVLGESFRGNGVFGDGYKAGVYGKGSTAGGFFESRQDSKIKGYVGFTPSGATFKAGVMGWGGDNLTGHLGLRDTEGPVYYGARGYAFESGAGTNYGVYGWGDDIGVYGKGNSAGGSFESSTGYAGFFNGKAAVTSTLEVGTGTYAANLFNQITGSGNRGLSIIFDNEEKAYIDRLGTIGGGYAASSPPRYGFRGKGSTAGGSFESDSRYGVWGEGPIAGGYFFSSAGYAVHGIGAIGVLGQAGGSPPSPDITGDAIWGGSTVGAGVRGVSFAGHGVAGSSGAYYNAGVYAENTGSGAALKIGTGTIVVRASNGTGSSTSKLDTPAGDVILSGTSTSATIYNGLVTINSIILLTVQSGPATSAGVTGRTAGTSFTIKIERNPGTLPGTFVAGDVKAGYLIIN
jgi:hypothetical protein